MATATQQDTSLPQGLVADSPIAVDRAVQDGVHHIEQQPQPLLKNTESPLRPLMIYTRVQLLLLHASPLVQTPLGMPALRDWFG